MYKLLVWFLFIGFDHFRSCLSYSDRPVIGILSQEIPSESSSKGEYRSIIAASYVKAVEASGARVVPIFVDRNQEYYNNLAGQVNGYLFPGGGANVTAASGYARSSRIIYDLVLKLNREGKNVPILGVCLGMEMLANIVSGQDIRTKCSVVNEALNLNFLPGYKRSSLYSEAYQIDIETLSKFNSTLNHHRYCITQETLNALNDSHWRVLSTSKGSSGDLFISSMEMRELPIVAIIFHPEKNTYEWNSKQENPHDARSIRSARLFFDWLVAESRKNDLQYRRASDIMDELIQNYEPIFTGKNLSYYFQTYFFS